MLRFNMQWLLNQVVDYSYRERWGVQLWGQRRQLSGDATGAVIGSIERSGGIMNSISQLLPNVFAGVNGATGRLSATLDQRAAALSTAENWRESIVDLAKLIGLDSDLDSRRQLAKELGFFGDFNDTAMMNIFLHNRIILMIVENHAVDIASQLDQLAAGRTIELDWRNSCTDLMKLFGLNSNLASRERLATNLGFTGELGTSGTMNMWLQTHLIVLTVDREGTLPDDLEDPHSSIASLLANVFAGVNGATGRLSATLDQRAAALSTAENWRESIVDLAKLIGLDSDLDSRRQLAKELGFFGDFNDTAMMNIFLHNRIILMIVENHAVDIASQLDQLAAGRTIELDWRNSCTDLMKLFGLNSNLASRERLATNLGFTGELGTSGTMNMWLQTHLIVLTVDREGTLPQNLAPIPDRTPEQRVDSLCRALRTKDLLVPALAIIWGRQMTGKPFRGDFEEHLYSTFNGLSTEEREGLGNAFDGYTALRMNGHGDCLFSNHLADKARNATLTREDFAAAFLGQGLARSLLQNHPQAGGIPGPGKVRPWRKGTGGVDSGNPEAPFPWITSISVVEADSDIEFGNRESMRPPPDPWMKFQFQQVCKLIPLPTGGFDQHCEKMVLQPPSSQPPGGTGELLFPPPLVCEGGERYTTADNECLHIPAQRAGDWVYLRGFNFIDDRVDVHLQSMDVTDRTIRIPGCQVFGDSNTEVRDEQGEVIADARVRDRIAVLLPMRNPDVGGPFPPGLYELSINVQDRPSNGLLLRIEPDEQTKFQLEIEGGQCIKETPGTFLSDDEISWTAFVGHLIVDNEQIGTRRVIGEKVQVDREPWKDMVDGKQVTSPTRLFPSDQELAVGGHAGFGVGGVRVISILGFEVDSEAAAEKQINSFNDAFTKVLLDLATSSVDFLDSPIADATLPALEAASGATTTTSAVTLLGTGQYMLLAWAAALVSSAAALWATWAPADMIALDIFTLNAQECFDRTDSLKPVPPDMARQLRTDSDDTDVLVTALEHQHETKEPQNLPGKPAIFRNQIQYRTQHDGDEFSNYLLHFKLARDVVQ